MHTMYPKLPPNRTPLREQKMRLPGRATPVRQPVQPARHRGHLRPRRRHPAPVLRQLARPQVPGRRARVDHHPVPIRHRLRRGAAGPVPRRRDVRGMERPVERPPRLNLVAAVDARRRGGLGAAAGVAPPGLYVRTRQQHVLLFLSGGRGVRWVRGRVRRVRGGVR